MKNINGTFSDLIRVLMNSSDYNSYSVLHKALINSGVNMSYSTLVSYCNGTTCPSFGKASYIIQLFEYQLNEEELKSLLERSKNTIRDIDKSERYVQRGVRLPVEYFDIPKARLEMFINKRASEVTGKNKSFNAYICTLIKEDLIKSGMLER